MKSTYIYHQRTRRNVSRMLAVWFTVTLIMSLIPSIDANAAIAHEESISANAAATSSLTTGTIQGGTDQLYVVAVANRENQGVATVSGGSLTWTERVDQCSGRNVQGLAIWTATGSPSSFTVTVTLDASSNAIAVTASRYSGADQTTPVEDIVYENTNGESGACTAGTDGSTASLTTGSTTADATHYVATNARNRTIDTADADYTERATDNAGSGGDLTRLYAHDYTKTATGDDTASHTLSSTTDWVTAGFVIVPEATVASTLTQAEYRWYENNSALVPAAALAAEDSAAFLNSTSEVARLRLGIGVATADLAASAKSFDLQYATSTGGPWTDVGPAAGGGGSDWYNANWQYRKKITIDNTRVSGTGSHSNFPVLIDISDADLSSEAQADGDDILFTSSDGTTKINHEIEDYTTGDLRAWVKVTSVSTSADTDIYMYYGYSSAANQENVTGVWTDYSLVWHLEEDPSGTAPQVLDSTSNSFDGTTNGTMTSGDLVTGNIGSAYDFDGSDDYVSKSDPTGDELDMLSGEDLSYSLWVKSGDTLDFDILSKGAAPGYRLIKRADGTIICQFRDGTNNMNPDTTTSIEDNSWRYIVCEYDGSSDTAEVHLNGSNEDSVTNTSFGAASNGSDLTIPTSGTSRVIEVDEVRVSKTVRGIDWASTEYNNQSSPGTFYSVGTEEIDTSTIAWKYYDDSSVSDDTTLTTLLLTSSDTAGSYSEANPTASNPNAITSGNQGEWDFAITPDDGIIAETVYYFRLIESDDTVLDTYTEYPELCLDRVPATDNRLRQGGWFGNERKQNYALDGQIVNGCGA